LAYGYIPPPRSNLAHLLFRLVVAGSVSVLLAYIARKQFEDRFLAMKNVLSSDHGHAHGLSQVSAKA
jgi:hypothetical protein